MGSINFSIGRWWKRLDSFFADAATRDLLATTTYCYCFSPSLRASWSFQSRTGSPMPVTWTHTTQQPYDSTCLHTPSISRTRKRCKTGHLFYSCSSWRQTHRYWKLRCVSIRFFLVLLLTTWHYRHYGQDLEHGTHFRRNCREQSRLS